MNVMHPEPVDDVPFHVLVSGEREPHQRAVFEGQSARINGALVDFSELIPLYGAAYVSDLLDGFARASYQKQHSYIGSQSRWLKHFLKFVAAEGIFGQSPDSVATRVFDNLWSKEPISASDFEDVVSAFFARLRDPTDTTFCQTTGLFARRNYIETSAMTLRAMAEEGFWPRLGRIRQTHYKRVQGTATPSLGELRGNTGAAGPPSAPQMSDIMALNQSRLSALRRRLAETFEDCWAQFQQGQILKTRFDHVPVEALAAAANLFPKTYSIRNSKIKSPLPSVVEKYFPRHDKKTTLAATLRLLSHSTNIGRTQRSMPSGWQALIAYLGGEAMIAPYLGATGRALAAAYGLVLIDSGFNIQSCDDLPIDPFYLSSKRGNQMLSTISSIKLRAKGKVVQATAIEENVAVSRQDGAISCIDVIARWNAMTRPFRSRSGSDQDHLWVICRGKGLSRPLARYSHASFVAWWRSVLKEHEADPDIGGLTIQRRNIRSTIIQIEASSADLNVASAALIGNHSKLSTTIGHYLNRGWFKSELERKIRHFQNLWEATFLSEIDGSAHALALPSELVRSRKAEAVETGLGFSCFDPFAAEQPGTSTSSRCAELQACAGCRLVRFVPSDSGFHSLIVTDRSLAAAEPAFITANPERWAEVWLPMQALVAATIQRLRQSHRRRHFEEIEALVLGQISRDEIVLFRPW